MQRTPRKRAAAERDVPQSLGPPVTRLAKRATRWPGHGKPRAGLPRRGFNRRAAGTDFYCQALRAINSHAQAPAGIEPAVSWPPLRGKSQAIEHNRALRKVAGAARTQFACWQPRSRPPSRVRVMDGYVWRPGPTARGVRSRARRFKSQSVRSRLRRQRECLARRCAQRWRNEPPPAQGRLLRRASALRASRPVLAAVPPVRPRKRGLPEDQRQARSLHALQGLMPPRSA